MKYFVNPSFSMNRLSDCKMVVSCNDYLKQFECDVDEFKEILLRKRLKSWIWT